MPWLAPILASLVLAAGPPGGAPGTDAPEDVKDPAASADVLALEVAGDDASLWARAGLALRFTGQAALPSTQVLFDPTAQAFATGLYLTPGAAQAYGSGLAFVSAGWEATPWLGFRLDVDSGLVRSQAFPETVVVCAAAGSPSGLVPVGPSTTCLTAARAVLPTTTNGSAQLTSNGQPFGDEARQTAFVRQLYADAVAGRAGAFHARLGRQRLRVADGLVYDDWGLGLSLDLDVGAFGPPLSVSAAVFYPSRAWPTGSAWSYPAVSASVEWNPSLGEHLGLWGAWSRDATGDAAGILEQGTIGNLVGELEATAPSTAAYRATSRRLASLLSAPNRGTTSLAWAGVSGRLEPSTRTEVRFTAGACFGTVGTTAPSGALGAGPVPVDVPTLGWLLSARFTLQPGSGFTLSPFLIWMTGGSPPSSQAIIAGSGSWSGFLAMSPYVTATNLFFQGGISESYADRRTAAQGVNARGVVAPGIQVGWLAGHGIETTVKAAWLWADEPASFGGSSYGPEVDLNVSWSPFRWLAVLAEVDLLALGNFFPAPGLARKFIVGLNVSTP